MPPPPRSPLELPKSLAYSFRGLVAEALADPEILKLALQRVKGQPGQRQDRDPSPRVRGQAEPGVATAGGTAGPRPLGLDLEGEGEVRIKLTWGESLNPGAPPQSAMRRSREIPASGSRALETATESVSVPSGDPLELLPLRTRAVIVLRANGMQMTIIAAVLGISRQTAYEHLRRARETLTPRAPISGESG